MTETAPVPHVFPFRLIERGERLGDREVVLVLGTAGGFLRTTEPWPVTLVAEALAQAILFLDPPESVDRLRLAALHNVRLAQQMTAGDRVVVDVEPLGALGELRRYRCRASRGGAMVALADVTVTS